MPPAVIDAMASFRTAIDTQQQAESVRMARAWLEVSRGLDAQFEALAQESAAAARGGRSLSLWHVQRMERYQSLLAQILTQQRRFAPVAADEIAQTQALLGRWGIAHSNQLITMQRPAVASQFDRLPVDAVTNMVGSAGNGAPLGDLLRGSWGDEGINVGSVLVRGTALGWHPTKIARAMRDEVNVTLERALLIARSEEMRVYREASRQQYIESQVVEGYRRVAAKSIRTCMACLMADGQWYPLSVPFEEHPNGRCTSIPAVHGAPPVVYEKGEEWFLRQDAATQRTMMGPGRYEAWQEGRFALAELVTVRHNDTWGNSLQVTPLRVLAVRPPGSVPRQQPPLLPPTAPPPTPVAPQPQGTPVSSVLTIPARSPLAGELREAMAAVDGVHGDGQLDTIPVSLVSGTNYEAAYRTRADKAVDIQLRRDGKERRISLVHEVGHWLDHQQLHATMGAQSDPAVRLASQRVIDTIKVTDQFQYWRDLRAGKRDIIYTRADGSQGSYAPSRAFMDYVMEDEELWARAYTQYIVIRSQQPEMLQELAAYRTRPAGFDQWDEVDFVPVANAIDVLMGAIGWRR